MNLVELLSDLAARGVSLWLEDGQLHFRAPKGGLTPQAMDTLKLHKAALVAWLEERAGFAAGHRDGPLAQGQLGLWLDQQIDPRSSRYHLVSVDRLPPGLDLGTLRRAAQALLERHPILRTVYAADGDGRPAQRLRAEAEADFAVVDGRAWSPDQLDAWRQDFADRPFDLATRSPMRMAVLLAPGAAGERQLHWAVHHIATDYASQEILRHDLAACCQALAAGQPPGPVAPDRLGYHDFVRWERDTLDAQGEALAAFWRDYLAGELPLLDLPAGPARPEGAASAARRHHVALDPALAADLRALARARRSTLYAVLLSAWQVLLGRYCRQEQFLVASPATTRALPGWTDTVGYFANLVLMRADLGGAPSFATLLQRTQATQQQVLQHQAWPHAEAMRLLQQQASPEQLRLGLAGFVCVALRHAEAAPALLEPVSSEQRGMPQALTLTFFDRGGDLGAMFTYDAARFGDAQIAALAGHLQVLLRAVAADPEAGIHSLPLLTEAEQRQLRDWNATDVAYPPDRTVVDLFEAQAAATPQAPALVFEGETLSYAQLNARANAIAHALIARGVGPEARVGICAHRSLELVAGMLGILKAGGAYVPLDPDYPEERLRFMLEDCGAATVLTQAALAQRVQALAPVGSTALCLDVPDWQAQPAHNPPRRCGPDGLAYVIYTSGSTGRPKGTLLAHAGAVNLAHAQARELRAGPGSRVLQFASLSFDAATWEVLMALTAGAALHLAPAGRLKGELLALLREQGITHVTLPPVVLETLPDEPLPQLTTLVVAGEACPPALAARWGRGRRFINAYGPTEATVCATLHACSGEEDGALPIGRPIANTRIHILDAHLQPLPAGVPGELCIAGAGLARGYLNRPELSAEKFVEVDVLGRHERLYRSGDLARWRPDGTLEYLGRIDHQVKLRGFRIELGEIEACLAACPGVGAAAVVLVERQGDKALAGYASFKQAPADASQAVAGLRDWLKARLPDYMVPAHLAVLEALPLSPNGKIDRKALAAIEPGSGAADAAYAAPRGAVETGLAAVFAQALGLARVGVHDDFFQLGGHSLLALRLVREVRERLGLAVTVAQLYQQRSVAGLAGALAASQPQEDGLAELVPVPAEGEAPARYPLSHGQRALWFVQQSAPGSHAYNSGLVLRLRGPLSVPKLRLALADLAARHANLRLAVHVQDGEPVQVLQPVESVELAEADARGVAPEALAGWVRGVFTRAFDLARGVFRPTLVRHAEDDHALVLSLHHLATDAGSAHILHRELAECYAARCAGTVPALPPLRHGYADYVRWEQALLERVGARLRDYWHGQLCGELPVLQLPLDLPRPPAQTFNGRSHVWRLDADQTRRAKALARGRRVSLFSLLLAVYMVQLHRTTGQADLLVGSAPEAGRARAEFAPVVGYFVNLVALRSRYDPASPPGFGAFLDQVAQTVAGALAHQHYPFPLLVQELLPGRDPSLPPLVQSFFLLTQHDGADSLESAGLHMAPFALEQTGGQGAGQFDLSLLADERDGCLRLVFDYNADLFHAATIARMAGHFTALLDAVTARPEGLDTPIVRLPLLTEAERRQLRDWNATDVAYPPDRSVVDLFEAQAAATPQAPALVFEGETLSYAQLNARANAIAHALIARGVGPETRVGLCAHRSLELVAGMLGILKAGGAYVPLDPDYPEERLRFMLEDCGAAIVLTQAALAARVQGLAPAGSTALSLDVPDWQAQPAHNPPRRCGPDGLAYVIYTSGSTGRPKGTLLAHAGAVNLALGKGQVLGAGPGSRVLQFASLSFDAATWEVLMALTAGAALHLAPAGRLKGELFALLREQEITHVTLPPVVLETLPALPLPQLSTLVVAGEACPPALAARWRPGRRFINGYGPTEATVCATLHECSGEEDGALPIGRPIPNIRVYVLDRYQQPLPPGVPGELCIAGIGVARGYLNRPELTAEKFIEVDVLGRHERLYRSGDLARWRADGTLEYLGRLDHQVKLRGFRIELGEIEACLAACPGVGAAAVVLVERHGDKALAGYASFKEAPADAAQAVAGLRDWLKARLPDYMVPAHLSVLAALPLSPNGKVDRKALPAPAEAPRSAHYVAPQTALERRIGALWQELLQVEHVGLHDSFFELGGHSLLLARLKSRLDEWGISPVSLVDLFRHPTVAALARHLGQAAGQPGEETAEAEAEQDDARRAEARRAARGAGQRQRQLRKDTRNEETPIG